MDLAFQLLIVVLEGGDEVSHLAVDGPRLLIGGQLLLEFDAKHLVLLAHLGQHVFQLNHFRPELFLPKQFIALHLLDLAQMSVLGVVPLLPGLIQLRFQRHGLVVQNGELRLQTLVLGRFDHHRLRQLTNVHLQVFKLLQHVPVVLVQPIQFRQPIRRHLALLL